MNVILYKVNDNYYVTTRKRALELDEYYCVVQITSNEENFTEAFDRTLDVMYERKYTDKIYELSDLVFNTDEVEIETICDVNVGDMFAEPLGDWEVTSINDIDLEARCISVNSTEYHLMDCDKFPIEFVIFCINEDEPGSNFYYIDENHTLSSEYLINEYAEDLTPAAISFLKKHSDLKITSMYYEEQTIDALNSECDSLID